MDDVCVDNKMKVLLLAMPDTVNALDAVTRIPNLGLCSIAGNLDDCQVRIVDLVFRPRRIESYLQSVVGDFAPDVVGLSAMSYQYDSARRAARVCRQVKPDVKIALGGYHASLMYQELGSSAGAHPFDFLVRGEGEVTFNRLVQKISSGKKDFETIPGLSFRNGQQFQHNPAAPLLDLSKLRLPDRRARLLDRANFLGYSFDCLETSRGCSQGCRFCSIGEVYGRTFRAFALERVIEDLKTLKAGGKKGAFFVDDNITLDVPRLKELCQRLVKEGLNSLSYTIQASVAGIASDPELARSLKTAGVNWVFLGIENGIARNLNDMGKKGVLPNAQRAVSLLQEQGIGVFGGFIVANPGDTARDIATTFSFARKLGVDHPIIQCLTPYPKTETREDLLKRGLVVNKDDFSLYNGFTCNVRTEHLDSGQINRAIFWSALRLYFHPLYLIRSRFWRFRASLVPALLLNNWRYLAGALRGRIFVSSHSW
jgi:anaerobic magnesium-protoporphyrin IX monomethyl ester cyclase